MTRQDILGPGYTAHTLDLAGGDVATLVHKAAESASRGAVLYLHGFVDYFFQTHLAEFYTERGLDFYALDLRRYGRSLRDGDTPYYTDDLAVYDEELNLAIKHIRSDGHGTIIAMGHSTGGLVLPLWLDRHRRPHPVDGLILNSPWLDLQYNVFQRTLLTKFVDIYGGVRPRAILPSALNDTYPRSMHRDYHGEWDFRTDWKPVAKVPVHAGWFRTIRRGHACLHQGLDLELPILLMRSDKSLVDPPGWSPEVMRADIVLDVAQMERWAPALGADVAMAVIPDAVHDIVLSATPVREHAFERIDAWLDRI